MPLAQHLDALCDETHLLKHAELMELSDIVPEELALLEKGWDRISLERRRQLVIRLAQMAEDDVCLDFAAIFKRALRDPDPEVREQSVAGLWECEDKKLISIFITLLQSDPAERVRAAAAQALGKFSALAENDKLLPKDCSRIRQTLLEIVNGPEESLDIRRRVIEAASPFSGAEVRKLILDAYQSPVPELRRSAVYAMGHNAHPDWLATIIAEISSSDPAMRYEAASACGNLGEEAAIPHILPLLRDDDTEVRLAVVQALGNIGGGVAKKALTSCLRSADEAVQEAAQAALEQAEYNEEPLPLSFRP